MAFAGPTSNVDPFQGIRTVLWVTLWLNLIATLAKLVAGYWTGSLSLIADGYDSVFDSASNVVGLIGIGIAAQPADSRHPYGHRKAETLTSLVIAMMLFLTTWELIGSAIQRLRDPSLISGEVNVWSFGALAVSICIHLVVVRYELGKGRQLHSDVLIADAMHTRADVFVSISVVAGLIVVRLGYPLADPIMALVVAAFIAKIGIDIIRQASSTLMDEVAVAADELERIVMSVPGVISCHRLRTHGHETAVMADLHIRVEPTMTTDQSHAIAHEVERRLRGQAPTVRDVVIHVEPATSIPKELTQQEITLKLRRLADGLGVGVHNIWAYELHGAYYLELHLEADGMLSLRGAHDLASSLEDRARAEIPQVAEVTTHIEPRGELARELASSQADGDTVEAAEQVIMDRLGPGASHQIQVHRSASGLTISLHCYLPGDMTLAEAHRTGAQLERELWARLEDVEQVVVHTEPTES